MAPGREPLDELAHRGLGQRADERVDDLAVDEREDRRDRLDREGLGDAAGCASTSTFASSTAPPVSATTFSRIGPSVLHGPHHSAQRSTTTGTVVDRSMTSVANVASVTSVTRPA